MVVKKILGRIIPRSLQAHRREVDEIPKNEYYAKRLVEEDREPLKTFVGSLGEKFEERGKQVMIVALGSSVLEYEARREHHHHDKEGNLKQDRTYLDIDLSVFPIAPHTLSTWKPIVHQVVSNVVTDSQRSQQP